MVLHTTPDGQITYEGLPVVNQEEVKKWINELERRGFPECPRYPNRELPDNVELTLPDEEFAWYPSVDTPGLIFIYRKPVSEEGEKKEAGEAERDHLQERLTDFILWTEKNTDYFEKPTMTPTELVLEYLKTIDK